VALERLGALSARALGLIAAATLIARPDGYAVALAGGDVLRKAA
jgi:hypothetical protein